MGSFSYTCQLSGVPITAGTKAALLPLIPRDNAYDCEMSELRKNGKASLISNDGCNLYFYEFCYPIFGEYDDYGGLENIVEDDNTKVLEKYFKMKIQDIVDVLCDNRKDGTEYSDSTNLIKKENLEQQLLFTLSSTWIHGDVYDKLVVAPLKDYFDKLDLGTAGLLKYLGFELAGTDTTKKRYDQKYKKDGLIVYSDGTWLHIDDENDENGVYDLKAFKKYCEKNNVSIDVKEVDKWGKYEQIYKLILPDIKSLKGYGDYSRKISRMLLDFDNGYDSRSKTFIDFLTEKEAEEVWELVLSKTRTKNDEKILEELKLKGESLKVAALKNLPDLYFNEIKENGNEFLLNNIVGWHKVKSFYYPTGRFLYPIGSSEQFGNFPAVKVLLESALSVVNERLKDYESEEEEKLII